MRMITRRITRKRVITMQATMTKQTHMKNHNNKTITPHHSHMRVNRRTTTPLPTLLSLLQKPRSLTPSILTPIPSTMNPSIVTVCFQNHLFIFYTPSMEMESRYGKEGDDLGEMTIRIKSSQFYSQINEQSRSNERAHPSTNRSVDGTQ